MINKLKASNTGTYRLNIEDKIIEAINYVRNKNKQRLTIKESSIISQ